MTAPEREFSLLAAAIAHEINQPLMAISANAGAGLRWLRRTPPRPDQVAGLLQDIVAQSQRAGKIIQALQAPHGSTIDDAAQLEQVLAVCCAIVEAHGGTIRFDAGPPQDGGDLVTLPGEPP